MSNYQFLKPYHLKKDVLIKNRVVMAPMTTKSSYYNGALTGDEIKYYAMRSGGVGMVITGAISVSEEGKGFEGGPAIYDDNFLPQLQRLASAIKINKTKAIAQLFHAGRKSTTAILRGKQPVSASAVAAEWPPHSETPRELTNDEIEVIIQEFAEGVKRIIEAGFDGVEIHGANTYLIQEFFSPHSNRRTDKWGGNRDKRMTFALEILKAVKKVINEYANDNFILGYRISPEEIENPGIRLEDSLYFVKNIQDQIDYLHLSMGSYNRTSLNDKSDTRTILSQFKAVLNNQTPIITVGSIKTPQDAEDAMTLGADFIALGRELINEPKWVQKVESNDETSIRLQISPKDMDDLAIPAGMQDYLIGTYKDAIDFTSNQSHTKYSSQMAPMEGYKKR